MRSASVTIFRVLLLAPLFLSLTMPGAAQSGDPFTFFAIGDAGDPGPIMLASARGMTKTAAEWKRRGDPVKMLLFLGDNFYPNGLNIPEDARRKLISDVLDPFAPLMREIGRGDVRAIAGNHDYYCRTVNKIPFNSCVAGNAYAREIELWSYHYYSPASVRRPIAEGSRDSVEVIFFDSAFLLAYPTAWWRPVLDSLERLLRASAAAPGVTWRLFMAHHSPYTVGEHGGYRRWMSSLQRVGWVGNCYDDRMDPFRYIYQFFSNQDNCAPGYRTYSDTLLAIIGRSGAKIQAMFAGHDHSLQLINVASGCDPCPRVFVVSGAGSKRDRVRSPDPPRFFTHPINNEIEQGRSIGGFVAGIFEKRGLALSFIDGETGEPADMGGGRKTFVIDRSGALLDTR